MLMVACFEMTSGESGVSFVTSTCTGWGCSATAMVKRVVGKGVEKT